MPVAEADELLRTQQYLAEVIDECVFVEKQRDLMERRLSAQIDTQKSALEGVMAALHLLCQYTCWLERAVMPGALASLPAASPARHDLAQARALVQRRVSELGARVKADADSPLSRFLLSELPDGVAAAPSAPAQGGAAESLTALLGSKAHFVDALTKAADRLESVQATASSSTAQVDALRTRMDELARLVEGSAASRAAAHSSAVVPAPQPSSSGAEVAVGSVGSVPANTAVRFAQARVLAYEKTVQALNNELALLYENYAALSRASARELEAAKRRGLEAQRRHDDQVAECDAILGRLSLELEQLIRENAQLKQKLRGPATNAGDTVRTPA